MQVKKLIENMEKEGKEINWEICSIVGGMFIGYVVTKLFQGK
jgi:hypothetical protein